MSGKGWGSDLARATLISVAASLLAAWIIGQSPELKAWMRRQQAD